MYQPFQNENNIILCFGIFLHLYFLLHFQAPKLSLCQEGTLKSREGVSGLTDISASCMPFYRR